MTDCPATADIDLIQKVIPHRYPFLLVDRVSDIVASKSATGLKNVTMNEPQFTGHFPAAPIFPGVMQIEALAQTASVLVGLSLDLVGKNALVYFMGVDKCKFRRKVVPGDQLLLKVEALRGGGKVWKFKGEASVDGETACECEFMAMIDVPKE
ncbi:3-hydroxyacyl-ACP dehydratase FabZ [Mangrovicoccus ximenensis]|uniref:3-hydroxyacyl-ACP dehydratase FabZ n=1 Tax=Mangrovicoccus ximenensis TaxID=1911570 RepID=UPI000D3A4067|nr:3-hydroxyacyl-ACP dehydratase FabZ [Mangrovicoccus ximenensis]